MIQYVLTVSIILIVFLYFTLVVKPKRLYKTYLTGLKERGYKVYNVPFVPLGLPFLQIIKKGTDQGDALKICKTVYPEHDVVMANSFNKIALDFSHPDFIRDFYTNEHLYTFPKLKIFTLPVERAMGSGIPFSEGEVWKRKRRIINKVFNFDFVKSMTYKIEGLCQKAIGDIEKIAKHEQTQEGQIVQYSLIELTTRMFSSVIMECFMGGATDETLDGKPVSLFMNQLITDVTQQAFAFIPIFFGISLSNLRLRAKDRDINRRIKLFKQWGMKYIKKKIQIAQEKISNSKMQNESDDLIEALVRSRNDTDSNQQDLYTDAEILQEFCTFFVVGTDTTSHYLMMMIYYIAQNPQVEAKLREEIQKEIIGKQFSFENLKKLVYIDWVQKQTTRMYGPVNQLFLREAAEDTYLNGLPIKKGTYVTIQHVGNNYSQKYFKQPFAFRPERWQSQCDNLAPYVTGGFSAGARTCIGKHLVAIESKIALICFLRRYKKIILPQGQIKMVIKFLYTPEYFQSRMIIDQKHK